MYETDNILNVIFLAIEEHDGLKIIHYFNDESQDWAIIINKQVLTGQLLKGSSIRLDLRAPIGSDSSVKYAQLLIDKQDLLPEDAISQLESNPPAYRTPFGFISDPSGGELKYYILLKGTEQRIRLCTGEYSYDDQQGTCRPVVKEWIIRQGLVENYFLNQNWPTSPITKWIHNSFSLDDTLEYLSIDNLSREFRNYISDNQFLEYFFSDDWSPEFYRKQAKLGFIAITANRSGSLQLVPQLQNAYAVLDWKNLLVDKKVGKILSGKRIKDEYIRLIIDSDPQIVLDNLKEVWKGLSWLSPQYDDLMIKMASEEEREKDKGFKIWGVRLTVGEDSFTVAGELGYTMGRTYTSLTGFFKREKREYNNFGKLQLHMLARALEEAGILFWNLGHPQMKYKTDMGAKFLPRFEFLKRWDEAVVGDSCNLNQDNTQLYN